MSADATLWSSEAWASAPDAYLLLRTREGSAEAFGELWRRHLPAAYAVAGRHRGRSAPEDIVAEAAARVLSLIREGRGPDEHFRAYFLSAVRTVAIDQGRRDLRVVPAEADDLEGLADPHEDLLPVLTADDEGLALVREAFAGLSERDQRVLWHTTVEGAAPRAVAPALGMTANAVSVRAMRARESLRALYLDARAQRGLAGADSEECRWTVNHLGALVRGRLPKRQTERAEAHVAACPHAAALADDLRLLHDGFPALLVPLVVAAGLGTPGFVGVAALSGLTGAAAATGVAGSVGSVSTGGAAAGPSGPAPGTASSNASAGASSGGTVAQVASQVTALVAGLAVTAGVAGALAVPGAPLAQPFAARPPSASTTVPGAPSVTPGAGGLVPGLSGSPSGPTRLPGLVRETASASAIPSAVGLTGTPSADQTATPGPASPAAVGATQPGAAPAGGAGGAGGGAGPGSTPTGATVPPVPASTADPGSPTPPAGPTPTPTPPTTVPPPPPPPPPPVPPRPPSPRGSSPPATRRASRCACAGRARAS